MNRWRYLIGLAAIAGLCNGCIPLLITTSPGASGTVVDAGTYAPIDGAHAVIHRVNNSVRPWQAPDNIAANARSPHITEKNGRFSIDAEHRLILYFPSPAMMPNTGELVITHAGYEPAKMYLVDERNWAGASRGFLTGDITNLTAFTMQLKMENDPVSVWLMRQFSESARTAITNYPSAKMSSNVLQSVLVKELNQVVNGPSIYETNRFHEVTLSPDAFAFINYQRRLSAMTTNMDDAAYRQAYPSATTPSQVTAALNRRLLEQAYRGDLSTKSGGGYYKNVGVVLLTPIPK